MTRLGSRWGVIVCLVLAVCMARVSSVYAITLDEAGELKLGVRLYSAVRVGSEDTTLELVPDSSGDPTKFLKRSLTFPVSAAGHVRQLRDFIEAEFDHDILRLVETGVGPFNAVDTLPFKFDKLRYHLVYRGEYEGVYDFGPSEYRNSVPQFLPPSECANLPPGPRPPQCIKTDILVPLPAFGPVNGRADYRNQVDSDARRRLRRIGSIRNRLFQAFIDAQVSNVFIRFGRQVLSWGETDAFRLLDNINPLDSSFGGFLVSLDERRLPLDMLLANYYIGELGPLTEMFVEGYAAIDKSVGYSPGTPAGSPWTLPNLGAPSVNTYNITRTPSLQVKDTRGGAIVKFIAPVPGIGDANFSLAHYYTYLDIPFVQSVVSTNFPRQPVINGFQGAIAIQSPQRTQITGGTTSFAIPSRWARLIGLGGEPIVRSELAYFRGEPRFRQLQLDPFLYRDATGGGRPFHKLGVCPVNPDGTPTCVTGGTLKGDSWNFVLGLDMNQFIRFLNPQQSFFFTTQFFYKHLLRVKPVKPIDPDEPALGNDREVLPVPQFNQSYVSTPGLGAVEPKFVTNPTDQFLQTLLIATSYYSGQVNPALVVFYDWSGSAVVAPTVTLSRDPWRFTLQYNFLTAGQLKGASGVSLLRDRDNFLFQLEYVI